MQGSSFSIDFNAAVAGLAFAVFLFILVRWGQGFEPPHLKYSRLDALTSFLPSVRLRLERAPHFLMVFALMLFGLAFIDPHFFFPRSPDMPTSTTPPQQKIPVEGIAIYLLLDQSGSMAGEIRALDSEGRRTTMTKMDLLKQVTRDFIKGDLRRQLSGRSQDLLGLVAFARGAQILAPLTLDHEAILKELSQLNYTKAPDQDGTAIGYAIFKTANIITATRHYAQDLAGLGKPAYEIKSNVIILVTDGFQSPSSMDKNKKLRNIEMVEAADYARTHDIKLYIINVEPKMASEEFALHRKLLKEVAELTGGQFYLVDSSVDLARIYREIDQLEKSLLPIGSDGEDTLRRQLQDYVRFSLYPWLIAAGMVCMGVSIFLETFLLQRVP